LEVNMGANPTQAIGIVFLLTAFTLLAGAFAGGGFLLAAGAAVLAAVACYLFLKVKGGEVRAQQSGASYTKVSEVKG
jgi:hypothetical protein